MISMRPYTLKDFESLSQTIDHVCADTPWMSTQKFIPTNSWSHALENTNCSFHSLIIAESNGEVIGWCRSFPVSCKMPLSNAELGIGLLKEYRNQGIGSELIFRSVEWASTRSLNMLNLTVSTGNSIAMRVFENCGFEPVNVQDDNMLMAFDLS